MSRTKRVAEETPSVNGQAFHTNTDSGDGTEPAAVTEADLDFSPAALERKTDRPPEDPDFDIVGLRLNLSATAVSVKKAMLGLPTRKPDKSWWVRTHPDAAFRLEAGVIEQRGEGGRSGDVYLVAAKLHADLQAEPCFRPCLLALAVNRQGDLFLWPVNLPREGDRANEWSSSALTAIDLATKSWIRVAANMRAGSYDVWTAAAEIPAPIWPEQTFSQLLKLAFKDNFINTLDHPVLRQLQRGA